jgi:amidase
LTFAVKDLFDVAGQRTGAGNPDWLDDHPPAQRHASAVQALLEAGAELVGRTVTVEFAFGMEGDNVHYGMPVNPAAPDRIPGGSSCGSAAAVAGALCDAALGTDTGGSVRLPASYCGIYGFRPTHGRISVNGVVPLSPSFDTVGHFARDALTLERIGRTLLGEQSEPGRPQRVQWAADVMERVDPRLSFLHSLAEEIAQGVGPMKTVRACAGSLEKWATDYRTLMGHEAWNTHGGWIRARRPRLGAEVAKRFKAASEVTDEAYLAAAARRERFAEDLQALVADGTVICFPTCPGPAPKRGEQETYESVRLRAHVMTCLAGLARLPQITMPVGSVEGAPVGLSLLGAPGTDTMLLRMAVEFSAFFPRPRCAADGTS